VTLASLHVRTRGLAFAVLLAVVFLAFHLPYLPASLEDLDSVNFALGIRHFDVAEHQPHPPGYPLFIALAKAVHLVVPREDHVLALIGIAAGALGALAICAFFRELEASRYDPGDSATALCGTLLAVAAPLYWFTAARPLSDTAGLVAAVAVQAMILAADTSRALVVATLCAALAAGLRSQVVWLTLPLLVVQLARLALAVRKGQPSDDAARSAEEGRVPGLSSLLPFFASLAIAYAVGVLVWLIPLVALTGGVRRYWAALSFQGTADLTDIQMLWTSPTPRVFASALYYAFVAPWAVWQLAAVVLTLALAGAVALVLRRHDRVAALMLAAAFGPYFVFDIVFQETFTTRYALPLVVPVAYLAVRGALLLTRPVAIVAALCIAAGGAHIGGTSVAAFTREKAPAFRLLDDMRSASQAMAAKPVLGMDRREAFDLRRPIRWVGDQMAPVDRTLPSPPQHEWLELVKYWNEGGVSEAWFLADPLRTDIHLLAHGEPRRYRWPVPYPVLLGGVRPNELDFYRIAKPEWYVGNGWALTPEAAGVAKADGIGPGRGAIEGWIARSVISGGAMVFGGRNLAGEGPPVHITMTAEGADRPLVDERVPPGPFLVVTPLEGRGIPEGSSGYAAVHVKADDGGNIAVEQFDASATRPVIGFGGGWHEPEYNPRLGLQWRWLSERGEVRYHVPGAARDRGFVLRLEGESPLTYFSRPSQITIRVGDRAIRQMTLVSDFNVNILIPRDELPQADGTITLETDQTYIPAERSRRTGDRRHLGLRIFKCELRLGQ
jgi:hypothetical protein